MLNLAHPDIECQPLKLSSRGVYRGHVGLSDWVAGELIGSPTEAHVHIKRVQTLSPERVAVFGTVQNDRREVCPYALVAIVRDGKVAAMRSYLSDELTMERFGLLR